jgi:hypothetical protein
MTLLLPAGNALSPSQVVLDRVKSAERLPGVNEILLPSERGNRVAKQHTDSGMVPIEANLYHNLKVMASKADTGRGGAGTAASGATDDTSYKLQTLLLHPAASAVVDPFDASGAPLYQTATFGQPCATDCGPYDYTRSGNPTRTMLEEQVSWGSSSFKLYTECLPAKDCCSASSSHCIHVAQVSCSTHSLGSQTSICSHAMMHCGLLRRCCGQWLLRVPVSDVVVWTCSGLRWKVAAGLWPSLLAWQLWQWQ